MRYEEQKKNKEEIYCINFEQKTSLKLLHYIRSYVFRKITCRIFSPLFCVSVSWNLVVGKNVSIKRDLMECPHGIHSDVIIKTDGQ